MIRSVLRLHPRQGGDRELVEFFERRGILTRALRDGRCASAEMYVRLPGRDEVIISALWNSEADYDAWQQTDYRDLELAELEAYVEQDSLPIGASEVHEVVTSVSRSNA